MSITGMCRCVPDAQAKFGTFAHGEVVHCRLCRKPRESSASDGATTSVDAAMVTTLDHVPGHQVVAVLGAVVEIADGSGRGNYVATVQQKLRTAAGGMGANAVLGLTGSTFNTAAGVTGGQTVGMMLMGTAVVVEPIEPAASAGTPGLGVVRVAAAS